MPQPVVNILFDLDGTLTDPREGIVACFKHTLLELGYCAPPDSDLERYIGPPLQECFASLIGSQNREQIASAIALYRQRFFAKGMFENSIYPGVHSALAQLHAMGAVLYIATSKSRVFAERIVDHFGLNAYFRAVHGSELDGARANKADLIAYVLKKELLSPGSTFMIGDRAHDIIGAKANRRLSYRSALGLRYVRNSALQAQPCFVSDRIYLVKFCQLISPFSQRR